MNSLYLIFLLVLIFKTITSGPVRKTKIGLNYSFSQITFTPKERQRERAKFCRRLALSRLQFSRNTLDHKTLSVKFVNHVHMVHRLFVNAKIECSCCSSSSRST
ncbi:hypothetical protein L2E82_42905 [Cichorium intybus]|uniref:Uncharacterized protein n=1 Tax=Cichorium intybus TaxID=13427 RepID=A0ACB8ZMZ5_CICIN|nr:hypothetical protein L2E82_42905 [Cichorium intybus]